MLILCSSHPSDAGRVPRVLLLCRLYMMTMPVDCYEEWGHMLVNRVGLGW